MMLPPIFSEAFYTSFLNHRERVTLNPQGKFDVLPKESICSRIKRFLTFQQDAHIDKVNNQLKILIEQTEKREGPEFLALSQEIHKHGRKGYRYLEANLIFLRKKLTCMGQLHPISQLILKVVNSIRHIFGQAPIQLKTYEDSFEFHWTSGNYVNPFEKEGLKLTDEDQRNSTFSANSAIVKKEVQKLEKGLSEYFFLSQTCKNFLDPSIGTVQILGNLEINFDSEKRQFLAAINNPRLRSIYNPFNIINARKTIPKSFARHLDGLPEGSRTFRCFVTAKNKDGAEKEHSLIWVVNPTRQAPFQLDKGSPSLVLEPNVEYTFYNESRELIRSFIIQENR